MPVPYANTVHHYSMPLSYDITVCHYRMPFPYAITVCFYYRMPLPYAFIVCHFRKPVPPLQYANITACHYSMLFLPYAITGRVPLPYVVTVYRFRMPLPYAFTVCHFLNSHKGGHRSPFLAILINTDPDDATEYCDVSSRVFCQKAHYGEPRSCNRCSKCCLQNNCSIQKKKHS